jgi:hypothetical protein
VGKQPSALLQHDLDLQAVDTVARRPALEAQA